MNRTGLKAVGAAGALALLLLSSTFNAFIAHAEPRSTTSHSAGTATIPLGTWRVLSPYGVPHVGSAHAPDLIVPPGGSNCPSNAMNYTGSLAPYNCFVIAYDGSLHGVWLRQGSANTFGIAHFQTHNLDVSVVEDVIDQSQFGIVQSNGRYLYGAYYVNPDDGGIDQQVQVFEERGRPNAPGVTDGGELGVVTAFCLDQFDNEEQVCPGWVNLTL